jgi:predicted TIM-barrel fold metal-dependent hydrolase
MPDSPIIDVHSHATRLRSILRQAGITTADGAPYAWSPADTIEMMERNGIGSSILSPMPLSLDSVGADEARDRARSMNEELAAIVASAPDRFGAFGVLPLLDIEDAIAEAAYVLDGLKLDGVCIPTNVNGVYPGDTRFHPLFEELDRRGAVVFVHPTPPKVFDDVSLGIDGATLEFMFDSTRMITSLVYSGVLHRHRDLKVISTHGGGVLPYIASRIATHAETRNARFIPPMTAADVMDDLRSLYFDLTAAMTPAALASILQLMPMSHLLMGFDFPIRPEKLYRADLDVLASYEAFGDADRRAIRRDNAAALFPRFVSRAAART